MADGGEFSDWPGAAKGGVRGRVFQGLVRQGSLVFVHFLGWEVGFGWRLKMDSAPKVADWFS